VGRTGAIGDAGTERMTSAETRSFSFSAPMFPMRDSWDWKKDWASNGLDREVPPARNSAAMSLKAYESMSSRKAGDERCLVDR